MRRETIRPRAPRTTAWTMRPEGPLHVFVVRLWREPREFAATRPEWRDTIFNVVTRVQRRFRGLAGMMSALRDLLCDAGDRDDRSLREHEWWRRLTRPVRR